MFSSHILRTSLLLGAAVVSSSLSASAADPVRIVLQNGRGVQISAVSLQGENLVLKAASDGFTLGQLLPLGSASHVFGERPSELNAGIALLLLGKPGDALKLLEPILAEHGVTSSIPGNFWLETARAALVAYAVEGNSPKCTEMGKALSDATPMAGTDPFVMLGRALLMPPTTAAAERETALRDLTTDNLPADVCAYASIYRANLLKTLKRDTEALEAYLMVPGLFPSGGMILNAFAEFNAGGILVELGRKDEAAMLLQSAIRGSGSTLITAEANKRLESVK